MPIRLPHAFAVLSSFCLLGACSSLDTVATMVNPHRIDVRQGNYVDQEMVAQLKKGMTREQVRFVLGTPLMPDLFNGNRWDYVYRFQKGHAPAEQRALSVYFIDGRLDRVSGDVEEAETAKAAETAAQPRSRVIEIEAPAAK